MLPLTSVFRSVEMQVLLLLMAGLHMVVDGIRSHLTLTVAQSVLTQKGLEQ